MSLTPATCAELRSVRIPLAISCRKSARADSGLLWTWARLGSALRLARRSSISATASACIRRLRVASSCSLFRCIVRVRLCLFYLPTQLLLLLLGAFLCLFFEALEIRVNVLNLGQRLDFLDRCPLGNQLFSVERNGRVNSKFLVFGNRIEPVAPRQGERRISPAFGLRLKRLKHRHGLL